MARPWYPAQHDAQDSHGRDMMSADAGRSEVFISTNAGAILMRRTRKVSNCARSQGRSFWHRLHAAPHEPVGPRNARNSRNWFAVALLHEVRSAGDGLPDLMWFCGHAATAIRRAHYKSWRATREIGHE